MSVRKLVLTLALAFTTAAGWVCLTPAPASASAVAHGQKGHKHGHKHHHKHGHKGHKVHKNK